MAVVALISPLLSTIPKTELVPPRSKPITYGFKTDCVSIANYLFIFKFTVIGVMKAKIVKIARKPKDLGKKVILSCIFLPPMAYFQLLLLILHTICHFHFI